MAFTSFDKTIVAGGLAVVISVLSALPFHQHPPSWVIIATAALTPVAVFFKSNTPGPEAAPLNTDPGGQIPVPPITSLPPNHPTDMKIQP